MKIKLAKDGLKPGTYTMSYRMIRPGTAKVLLSWCFGPDTRHVVFFDETEGEMFWTVEPASFKEERQPCV